MNFVLIILFPNVNFMVLKKNKTFMDNTQHGFINAADNKEFPV